MLLFLQEFVYPDARDRQFLLFFHKFSKRKSLDVRRYNDIKNSIAKIEEDLKVLRSPLFLHLPEAARMELLGNSERQEDKKWVNHERSLEGPVVEEVRCQCDYSFFFFFALIRRVEITYWDQEETIIMIDFWIYLSFCRRIFLRVLSGKIPNNSFYNGLSVMRGKRSIGKGFFGREERARKEGGELPFSLLPRARSRAQIPFHLRTPATQVQVTCLHCAFFLPSTKALITYFAIWSLSNSFGILFNIYHVAFPFKWKLLSSAFLWCSLLCFTSSWSKALFAIRKILFVLQKNLSTGSHF